MRPPWFDGSVAAKFQLVFILLLGTELALLSLYVIGLNTGDPGVRPLFDLDQEANLPTWFSSMQLLGIAAVLGLYAVKPLRNLGVPAWLTVAGAAVFLFLSMDETAQVHENLARDLRVIEWLPRVRNDRGIWVFVYLAAALVPLVIAARYIPVLWRQRPQAVRWIVAGAAVVITGSMGVELIADQFLRGGAGPRSWYYASVAAEETLEMIGGTLMLLGAARLAFHDLLTAGATAPRRGRIAKPAAVDALEPRHLPAR